MILKQSWLNIADSTTVRWLRVFHLYKGFHRRSSEVGFFVKGSARVVEPPRVAYKGFKFKFNKKGNVCRAIIIRTARVILRPDGSSSQFFTNNAILIKKKQNIKSNYLVGPSTISLKRKKFKTALKFIL